jgi:hypothetical protein
MGGICRGRSGVLRVRIRCAITPIFLLFAVVLWSGTTPLDRLKDIAHSGLCDPV